MVARKTNIVMVASFVEDTEIGAIIQAFLDEIYSHGFHVKQVIIKNIELFDSKRFSAWVIYEEENEEK